MVYYMHSFGKRSSLTAEESSSSSLSDLSSSSSSSSSSDSSTFDDVSVDVNGYQFGKHHRKQHKDKFMARLMCAAKLGFLAALLMMLLGYLSVHLLDMKMFRKEDPVSRMKTVDWQKLCLYSGVVFLIVAFGSTMWASSPQ